MRFEKYIIEAITTSHGEERGKTTKVKGHDHDYFFDRMTGDGGTGKDAGHLHKIKAMVIKKADGHVHKMK